GEVHRRPSTYEKSRVRDHAAGGTRSSQQRPVFKGASTNRGRAFADVRNDERRERPRRPCVLAGRVVTSGNETESVAARAIQGRLHEHRARTTSPRPDRRRHHRRPPGEGTPSYAAGHVSRPDLGPLPLEAQPPRGPVRPPGSRTPLSQDQSRLRG